jgi:hypothetical protein
MYSRFASSVGAAQFPFSPRFFENFATMSGLLSVKYVSSMEPLSEPGLRFLEKFPIAVEPQPPKSRGPYLYLNERFMPRAYAAAETVAVAGSDGEVKSMVLSILADDRFHPDRFTLIAVPERPAAARTLALDTSDWRLGDGAAAGPGRNLAREALFATPGWLDPLELAVEERSPESLSVEIPPEAVGRWVVLSEKFAMFNGWTATVTTRGGRVNLPLFRANHVNTAILIPKMTSGPLELSYSSPGFHSGLVAFGVTSLAIAGTAVGRRRRSASGGRADG